MFYHILPFKIQFYLPLILFLTHSFPLSSIFNNFPPIFNNIVLIVCLFNLMMYSAARLLVLHIKEDVYLLIYVCCQFRLVQAYSPHF